jgi:hypothetical protein
VECFASNEVQGDLSFELDAMGAVLGHGFHPLKARQSRSIPNLQTVHRQGRIPRRQRLKTVVDPSLPCGLAKFCGAKLKPGTSLGSGGPAFSLY